MLAYYRGVLRKAPRWYIISTLAMTLFPSRKAMSAIYGVDERSPLVNAYYFARPFHLTYRALQGAMNRSPRE